MLLGRVVGQVVATVRSPGFDNVSLLLAGGSNEQTTMGRVVMAGVAVTIDDAGNDASWTAEDMVWASATGNATGKIVIAYNPTGSSADTDLIPLSFHDFAVTPDGTTITASVGVAGLGKVGKYLVGHLLEDGATVVATDVNPAARDWARTTHPEIELVDDTHTLITSDIDVYAPCALGGALDDGTVQALRAKVVAGGANNQLAHPGIEKALEERGILYTPDYLVNAGGVIQVADEIEGFNFERAKLRATGIFETTRRILSMAAEEGVSPAVAADRLAEHRMAEVGRLRAIYLG